MGSQDRAVHCIQLPIKAPSMTPSDLLPFAIMAVLFPMWAWAECRQGAFMMVFAGIIGGVLWWGAMIAGLILGELASQWAGLTW